MNNDNKSRNIFTVLILVIFIILSYSIIKSFFGDITIKKVNHFDKDGSFTFLYDTKLLNKNFLNEMYDENRTNKVVIDRNYSKTTGDIKVGKINLEASKLNYYFSNTAENPSYYQLTIKNIDYLKLYKVNESKNVMYFAILGSDLKYYTITMSINYNTDDMSVDNKEWVEYDKDVLGIYPNLYYKIIDDKCHIEMSLPILLNNEKYSKSIYVELRDKLEKSISIKSIDNYEYNYYSFDLKNVKLNNNVTLLLDNSKVYQYYSKNDIKNDISYTAMVLLDNNRYVSITEIDDFDKYSIFLEKNGYKIKEYNYTGIKAYLLYSAISESNDGAIYTSILFDIDNNYYVITPIGNNEITNNSLIDTWIDQTINNIIAIN